MNRKDMANRVAGEKALYPDEFITLGQISGGDGLSIKQISSWDGQESHCIGNLVINREAYFEKLNFDPAWYPYFYMNITKDFMEKRFGKLFEKSILRINGVTYYYNEWFTIEEFTVGEDTWNCVKWLRDSVLSLDLQDEIIWKI